MPSVYCKCNTEFIRSTLFCLIFFIHSLFYISDKNFQPFSCIQARWFCIQYRVVLVWWWCSEGDLSLRIWEHQMPLWTQYYFKRWYRSCAWCRRNHDACYSRWVAELCEMKITKYIYYAVYIYIYIFVWLYIRMVFHLPFIFFSFFIIFLFNSPFCYTSFLLLHRW